MESQKNIDVLHSFLEESNESLEGIENAFIRLENDPSNMEIIDEIFRPVHSLKGNSGFFDLTNINKFSHRLENLIDFIRHDKLSVNREIIDVLLTGVDFLQKMLDRAYEDPSDVELRPDEEVFLIDRVDKFKPSETAGTLQSALDLQSLLNEASDLGIDLEQNALISKVLNQLEKVNDELRGLITTQKEVAGICVFPEDKQYFYEGNEYSENLKVFNSVYLDLQLKRRIPEDLLNNYLESILLLHEAFHGKKGTERIFRTLKAMSNFFDDQLLVESDEFCDDIGELLKDLQAFFEIKEIPGRAVKSVGEILVDQDKITDEQLSSALDNQKKIGEILVQEGAVDKKDVNEALAIQNKQILSKEKSGREMTKTIRIDQHKLDDFANSVGELFINIDSFSFLKKQLDENEVDFEISSRFASTISSMDDRVTKLQENIMNIRKVPIDRLFQRLPKIVRQLSNSVGKDIQFVLSGEDTVIDKDLIEKIENPIVHMLRNAIDHGIEDGDTRRKKGKDPRGTIGLSANVDEYYIHLSIIDDGGGIDPQKMKLIALKNNFMPASELDYLTDKELVNLIFKAGFSTAETISDISGRGVGMDVVLSSINECNGTVDVDSSIDEGTTVSIRIPLTKTLVTKDALIIESSGQFFAIPSDEITTTLYADVNFGSILSKEKIVSYNDTTHNVICLNNFFYSLNKKQDEKKDDQVLVVCSNFKAAFLVDRMFNHQKIVLKNFTRGLKQFGDVPGISGYTLLGNEDIVLVVDIEDVVKQHMVY